jgi:dCMP deaminase
MDRNKAKKYLRLARYQADLFSKDPNTKVAAILLSPDTHVILSTGYNGIPRKMKDAESSRWERPAKYTFCVHAECNAICNAARSGTSVDGSIAVVSLFPCCDCAKMLIQSGITTIVSPKPNFELPKWGEQFITSMSMFKEVNIELILFDQDEFN